MKMETTTESATEWKNKYMKSKNAYQTPAQKQMRQPMYLNTKEISVSHIHEHTKILTQSVYLTSNEAFLKSLLDMRNNNPAVHTINKGNQQKFPPQSQPQSRPLFFIQSQINKRDYRLKQSLISCFQQSLSMKWQVQVLGIETS